MTNTQIMRRTFGQYSTFALEQALACYDAERTRDGLRIGAACNVAIIRVILRTRNNPARLPRRGRFPPLVKH